MKKALFLAVSLILFNSVIGQEKDAYGELKSLSSKQLLKQVNDSIQKLESSDLWNFLYHLKIEVGDLKPFNDLLFQKAEKAKYGLDIHFLTKLLLADKTDKSRVEQLLQQKMDIWDKGNWGEKMWALIREEKLSVKPGNYYTVDENGQKKYDLSRLISDVKATGEIGENPMLSIDYAVVKYPDGKLMETIFNLEIKDIVGEARSELPNGTYMGGTQGYIRILTRN